MEIPEVMLDDLLGSSVALERERDRELLGFLGISICVVMP